MTEYFCRSWQFLYFPSRVVRYIKLVGTHNTRPLTDSFHAVALEAYYTAKVPNLLNGLTSPTDNVATPNKGAVVVKGERDALLNDYFSHYDMVMGYTRHLIGIN